MPTTSRERLIPGDPDRVWSYAADPGRLPRWWPKVERVERSGPDDFTKWVLSPRGRAVALEFRLDQVEPGRFVRWEQRIDGTIFQRSLRAAAERIEFRESDDGRGVTVKLTIERKMRGTARLGGLMIARAQGRELDEALDSLERSFSG